MNAGLPLLQNRLASHVYGPGRQILEQVAGSTATYYHADHLGSVRRRRPCRRGGRPVFTPLSPAFTRIVTRPC